MADLLPEELQRIITEGYTDVVLFAEKLLGMPLHDGQVKFLRNATEQTNVLVPANRWGKTTVIAIRHIHKCFYKVGIGRGNTRAWERASYQTVNLSPHTDTTKPVFDAILQILRSSFRINLPDGKISNNECKIEWLLNNEGIRNSAPFYIPFVNGSSIIFRSTGEDQGKSIEGRSYGYISYDEGGQSNHLRYEYLRRILPRLGEFRGQFDLVSTPEMSSQSIIFHQEMFFKGGGDNHPREEGFYSQEGAIMENHFFLNSNPLYIDDMRKQFGNDPIFEQVIHGKFVFAGEAIFNQEDILASIDNNMTVERYIPKHKYVIGIDTAIGEDECVYTVLDVTREQMRVVRILGAKGSAKSPDVHMDDLINLFEAYNHGKEVTIILETWNGESKRFYLDLPEYMQDVTTCFGSYQPVRHKGTESGPKLQRKAEIIVALRKVLANARLTIPNDSILVQQLSLYREDDRKLKTDRLMSLALAVWHATDGVPTSTVLEFNPIDW